MYNYVINRGDVKFLLLDAEIRAAGVVGFTGLSRGESGLVAHFESEPTAAVLMAVDGLVTAHDPSGQTAAEIEAAARAAARAAVVAAAADQLISQIAAGLAANQSDQDDLASVTTVAACRVALGRMLNREAAIMGAMEKIVKYLKASA